jgi:hypothetical protein
MVSVNIYPPSQKTTGLPVGLHEKARTHRLPGLPEMAANNLFILKSLNK